MEITVIDESIIKEAENAIHAYTNHAEFVLNLESVDIYKNVALELAKLSKAIDTKRKEYTKPLREEKERIDNVFNPVIKKLNDISNTIIERTNNFLKDMERKEAERLARIAKENAEKLLAGKPLEVPPVVISKPIPKVSETKYWDYEIIDLNKVPIQFLQIDAVKVQDSIRAGVRNIPGLHISQKTRPVRR